MYLKPIPQIVQARWIGIIYLLSIQQPYPQPPRFCMQINVVIKQVDKKLS